jgi:uncharacterized BrkB/YihY/UPF0761 family membrane protein
MLIWIYYAAQIVLFGAEFTRVYAQERGRGIRPAKHAVRVDRKEIELPPLTFTKLRIVTVNTIQLRNIEIRQRFKFHLSP